MFHTRLAWEFSSCHIEIILGTYSSDNVTDVISYAHFYLDTDRSSPVL